jgi:hypothetical protein
VENVKWKHFFKKEVGLKERREKQNENIERAVQRGLVHHIVCGKTA